MFDDTSSPIARIPELRWLRQVIIERALTRGEYMLSGGARSDYYIDKFRLFADPQILRRIALGPEGPFKGQNASLTIFFANRTKKRKNVLDVVLFLCGQT